MLVVRGHGLLDSSIVPSQNHICHYLSNFKDPSALGEGMAAFILEDFFVEQFRLIAQHLVGFHPSAIEHGGHVRIAMGLLFSFLVSDHKGH